MVQHSLQNFRTATMCADVILLDKPGTVHGEITYDGCSAPHNPQGFKPLEGTKTSDFLAGKLGRR